MGVPCCGGVRIGDLVRVNLGEDFFTKNDHKVTKTDATKMKNEPKKMLMTYESFILRISMMAS